MKLAARTHISLDNILRTFFGRTLTTKVNAEYCETGKVKQSQCTARAS